MQFASKKRGVYSNRTFGCYCPISLLSSIVFASLNSARAKARDARRISDIKQLQLALELSYANTGTYPASNMGGFGWAFGSCDTGSNYFTNLAPLVSGGYISALPVDPINNRTTVAPRQFYIEYSVWSDFRNYF